MTKSLGRIDGSGSHAARPAPWLRGWHRDALALPSPNYGIRPASTQISLIIVHSISLPPGHYGGGEIHALFTNCLDWHANPYFQTIRGMQVSSHFLIARDGTTWQFVSCDERAWHAGRSAFAGRSNCNDFSIGIELEGLEGTCFEAAQYTRLAALCRDIRLHYPIDAITGHENVAPGRKFDPGAQFDWQRLQQDLHWPESWFSLHSTNCVVDDAP